MEGDWRQILLNMNAFLSHLWSGQAVLLSLTVLNYCGLGLYCPKERPTWAAWLVVFVGSRKISWFWYVQLNSFANISSHRYQVSFDLPAFEQALRKWGVKAGPPSQKKRKVWVRSVFLFIFFDLRTWGIDFCAISVLKTGKVCVCRMQRRFLQSGFTIAFINVPLSRWIMQLSFLRTLTSTSVAAFPWRSEHVAFGIDCLDV